MSFFYSKAQNVNWGWGPEITTSLSGQTLTCSVYDPIQMNTVTQTYSYVNGLMHNEGVVSWYDGFNVHVTIYDVKYHMFDHQSYSNSNQVQAGDIKNLHRVVAWTNGYNMNCATYDASQSSWKHQSYSNSTNSFTNFLNKQSHVAWSNGYNVAMAVYDAEWQTWKQQSWSNSTNTYSDFDHNEGLLAWTNGYNLNVAIYNPFTNNFSHQSYSNSNTLFGKFVNMNGMTAWNNGNNVCMVCYDPVTFNWEYNSVSVSQPLTGQFSIMNGVLSYNINGTMYNYGYNASATSWQSNFTTVPTCNLKVNQHNIANLVSVTCLSIGAYNYAYNMGDNHIVTSRNAYKSYNNAGVYSINLNVSNAFLNNSCILTVTIASQSELLNNGGFQLYPSLIKQNEIIHLKSEEIIAEVQIANAVGKIIYMINNLHQHQVELPTKTFTPGVYLIKLTAAGNRNFSKRIVVQ